MNNNNSNVFCAIVNRVNIVPVAWLYHANVDETPTLA